MLAKIYLENRIEVGIDEVSPYVLEGTVATEDVRFYDHHGIDVQGIVRALVVNITSHGTSEGASTITQQLVRNTVLLDEMSSRTVERKVREMYIALQVEKMYTKDQILMMYLNVVNYGNGNYGIEAASRDYFGCHASELTLSEAAMLIGIPQSPNANNPREHYEAALSRRNLVLDRMLSNGKISQKEYDEALADRPEIQDSGESEDSVQDIAPYFVDYVRDLLSNSDEFPESDIARGGLDVYTTLDPKAQRAANEAVEHGLQNYEDLDASLVSIDPHTGYILAMVGGKDYESNQFNLATQMSRQAGSSFKTFTLAAALEAGVDPQIRIDSDSPAVIGKWEVNNSEGEGGGMMSIEDATTYSVNTVYARLVHELGPDKAMAMAKKCGITSELQPYDSIALGTFGVNPLEMASAYGTFANEGVHQEPVAITEILNTRGERVYMYQGKKGEQAVTPALAAEVSRILQTVVDYGTGTGAQLWSGQPAAGKTGTSEGGRDLWFCGYTPQLVTAVWSGYRQERETNLYGGTICAPIWREYTDAVLGYSVYVEFPQITDEQAKEELHYTYDWDFSEFSDYDASASYDFYDEEEYVSAGPEGSIETESSKGEQSDAKQGENTSNSEENRGANSSGSNESGRSEDEPSF